jgi:phosphatidylserine/phosphatidylglycerophosphate/cardiolipin synthase-like enzyme
VQAFLILIILVLLAGCGTVRTPAAVVVPVAAPRAGQVVLHQDAEIFSAVHRLASEPGGRLFVEMYEFGRADIASQLSAAHAAGVDVRLIYDPSVAASARTAKRLARLGVPVWAYPIDDRRHQIDHVKLLLSATTALVGGMNWGATSSHNHDYVLETRAPGDLARLLAIFEQDWSLAGGHPSPLAGAPPGERVLETTPGADIRGRLLTLITGSRHEVEAEIFVLTDPDVEAALAAAHRRGVRVRVLLDPHQDSNPAALATLRGGGVEARFYPIAPGAKLHAKVLRADGRLLVGSANWTLSGLGVNHELDLEVADPEPVAAFGTRFESDWSRAGGPVAFLGG